MYQCLLKLLNAPRTRLEVTRMKLLLRLCGISTETANNLPWRFVLSALLQLQYNGNNDAARLNLSNDRLRGILERVAWVRRSVHFNVRTLL